MKISVTKSSICGLIRLHNYDVNKRFCNRVATDLENMENLENSGDLKNCQNLWKNSGKM